MSSTGNSTPGQIRTAIVGVDGSPASKAALEWARRTCGAHGEVHEVHVASPRATALLDAAQRVGADLVVIGVHGQSELTPRRVGRLASALLATTTIPLAIVGDGAGTPGEAQSTVVAGVGQGAATTAALGWAGEYSRSHGTSLRLIRAVPNRPVFRLDGLLDVAAWYIDRDMARGWAVEDLQSAAAAIAESTDDDLTISWSARTGSVGPVLVEASADAAVLVIGLHADESPAAADATAGDVDVPHWLHHPLTHAPCPVVVVPAPIN